MSLTPSMELRIAHIENALDLALKENNAAMLEVIERNADKLRKEYLYTHHSSHIAVRKKMEEILNRIKQHRS